jgi:hypothetical protein
VHIELTDHLRCPQDHPEAFLVLLPDRMEERRVVAGHLGCPACGWSTAWTDSVPDFGGGWHAEGIPPFDALAAQAMLGLGGAGGWIALAGNAGALAEELAELLPGVSIVAINPPGDLLPSATTSVIRSNAWPLKTHSMRGVILGSDAMQWQAAAMSTTLPGLRTVGVGEPPHGENVQLLGDADGVWVAVKR